MTTQDHAGHSHAGGLCQVCQQTKTPRQLVPAGVVRDSILELIKRKLRKDAQIEQAEKEEREEAAERAAAGQKRSAG